MCCGVVVCVSACVVWWCECVCVVVVVVVCVCVFCVNQFANYRNPPV